MQRLLNLANRLRLAFLALFSLFANLLFGSERQPGHDPWYLVKDLLFEIKTAIIQRFQSVKQRSVKLYRILSSLISANNKQTAKRLNKIFAYNYNVASMAHYFRLSSHTGYYGF